MKLSDGQLRSKSGDPTVMWEKTASNKPSVVVEVKLPDGFRIVPKNHAWDLEAQCPYFLRKKCDDETWRGASLGPTGVNAHLTHSHSGETDLTNVRQKFYDNLVALARALGQKRIRDYINKDKSRKKAQTEGTDVANEASSSHKRVSRASTGLRAHLHTFKVGQVPQQAPQNLLISAADLGVPAQGFYNVQQTDNGCGMTCPLTDERFNRYGLRCAEHFWPVPYPIHDCGNLTEASSQAQSSAEVVDSLDLATFVEHNSMRVTALQNLKKHMDYHSTLLDKQTEFFTADKVSVMLEVLSLVKAAVKKSLELVWEDIYPLSGLTVPQPVPSGVTIWWRKELWHGEYSEQTGVQQGWKTIGFHGYVTMRKDMNWVDVPHSSEEGSTFSEQQMNAVGHRSRPTSCWQAVPRTHAIELMATNLSDIELQ